MAGPAKSRLRILLVDDHPLVRQGLCRALESQSDLETVGHVSNDQAAIQEADLLSPDAIVNDRTQAVIYALCHGWNKVPDTPYLGLDA
jgi:chemotaxis response regulator CheB